MNRWEETFRLIVLSTFISNSPTQIALL
jgi:hypothetical protein